MKVVDASVLAALVFSEPGADEAAARIGREPLAAPSLLPYELASVCARKIDAAPDRRNVLLKGLDLYEGMGVRLVQVRAADAVAIAEPYGLTTYDAAYLWLARELGVELLTFDRRLQAATRRVMP